MHVRAKFQVNSVNSYRNIAILGCFFLVCKITPLIEKKIGTSEIQTPLSSNFPKLYNMSMPRQFG